MDETLRLAGLSLLFASHFLRDSLVAPLIAGGLNNITLRLLMDCVSSRLGEAIALKQHLTLGSNCDR